MESPEHLRDPMLDADLTTPQNDVWQRLYDDSQRKKDPDFLSEENSEEPKRSGPRHKIEEDLFARSKVLQAKKRAKCAELKAQQRKEMTGMPEINPTSRRIAENPKNEAVDVPVKSIEQVARTIRTRKQRSIMSGNLSASAIFKDTENPSTVDVRVNLSKFHLSLSQRDGDPKEKELPQMRLGTLEHEAIQGKMNAQQGTADEDSECPGLLEDGADVVKRTMHWKERKDHRIKKQMNEKQNRELDGCTFKPTTNENKAKASQLNSRVEKKNASSYSQVFLSKKSDRQSRTFERDCLDNEVRTGIHYGNLSPTNRKMGYSSGFNMPAFVGKAQPMLDYKALAPQ